VHLDLVAGEAEAARGSGGRSVVFAGQAHKRGSREPRKCTPRCAVTMLDSHVG
jgi:hypothetical protein